MSPALPTSAAESWYRYGSASATLEQALTSTASARSSFDCAAADGGSVSWYYKQMGIG